MDQLFITAAVWFLLGFGFHAGLVWYDNRQKARLDRFDRVRTALRIQERTGRAVYCVPDPLMLVDCRKELELVN